MTPIWGADEHVSPLVADICGFERGFDSDARAMGVLDKTGRLIGGLVFHNWAPEYRTIEVTAGFLDRRWCTRGVLAAATRYGFETCGCYSLIARTDKDNPARRLWRALGSKEHEIPHLMGPGVSQFLYVLTQDAWSASKFAR